MPLSLGNRHVRQRGLCLRGLPLPAFSWIALVALIIVPPPLLRANDPLARPITLGLGGAGGVYFYVDQPGELIVDVAKRDRHRYSRRTDLRAILAGPDRIPLEEVTIPDDGQAAGSGMGALQQARLQTTVRYPGVYVLNVTVSQDRYGDEIVWGFRSNCPRYLIETARGHRDQRHEEPIELLNPEQPTDVCFLPRQGKFAIEVERLPSSVASLEVFDDKGQRLRAMDVDGAGRAVASFDPDRRRGQSPWCLRLPAQQALIHIDGVTRWDSGDALPNQCLWSPDAKSFFPWHAYRWLITPYHRTVYGQAGEKREVTFSVHNNSDTPCDVNLAIEFPGQSWPASLSHEHLRLKGKQREQVTLRLAVPADSSEVRCHVRATVVGDESFSTYSTVIVRRGKAPADDFLAMPIELKPYQHENAQFGYLPDYPLDNQVYFDTENRPLVRTSDGLAVLRDGSWERIRFAETVTARDPQITASGFTMIGTKIAFDRDNDVYCVARCGAHDVMLHSSDGGRSFRAHMIPGASGRSRSLDMEQFSGANAPEGPPPILRYTRVGEDPRLIWRKINKLELILPEKRDGRLVMGEPILISDQCIGLAAHSGIPSTVVSQSGRVHVVWAEATDPEKKVPGVPTFAATYDVATRRLSKPAFLAYGPPANDIHNTPSITMTPDGLLHVLAGTHGQPFPYARSLAANDAGSGWTEAELTGKGLRQTYIGLVTTPDGTLHTAFRLWRQGVAPHPASIHATLAYQRKRPGEPWEPPRVLIVSAFSEYSVFYHRLTVDREGRLFLSYDYWSTHWFYRNDHPGSRRALIMSPDGGDHWKLVQSFNRSSP